MWLLVVTPVLVPLPYRWVWGYYRSTPNLRKKLEFHQSAKGLSRSSRQIDLYPSSFGSKPSATIEFDETFAVGRTQNGLSAIV